MKHFRLCYRGALLVVVSTFFIFLRSLINLVSDSETAGIRRGYLLHRWAILAARILCIDIRVTGAPPLAPFFLTANHLSYVDIVVFSALLPCRFVSRGDLAHWPLLGYLSRSFDTIFIDRNRQRDALRVNQEIATALRTGPGIVVFPEGTTSSGETVLPFRTALLEPMVKNGFPVSVAAIKYSTGMSMFPVAQTVCWWGDMGFASHFLRLLQIPGIKADVSFGEDRLVGHERKQLGNALRSEVQGLFNRFCEGVV